MTFLDEEGNPRQFTWRTIQTWFYRYKNHGITGMTHRTRKDKGQTRKVTPEELLEALNAARPHFHDQAHQQAGPLSLLHREGPAARRPHRPDHLLPLHPRIRTARPRRQTTTRNASPSA